MKFRSTLVLVLLAAGLGTYVWLVEVKRPDTAAAREQAQMVLQFDRAKIDSVAIKNTETRVELRKQADQTWVLEQPLRDRADPAVLEQLFASLENLRHDAVVGAEGKGPGKSQLKEFGLSDSETRLELRGSGQAVELILGKDAAVEGKIYARVEGRTPVYVIASDLRNQISKKADDFRDRKLTALQTPQVERVVIQSASGIMELERKNQHWTLKKPLTARGDDSKIGDLISQATTVRVESFVADSANLAAYGLLEPRGSISLFTEEAKEPVVLQLGSRQKDGNGPETTYAKLSNRDSVVLLPKTVEKLLETKPNDLRDRDLVRVDADIVDRITLEPAGKSRLVLARKGESWVRKAEKDLPVNAALATALLNALRTQPVVEFVTDVATDLPKYGLDHPQAKVTLSSFASENTAETSAGEKPIVSVLFGNEEGGNVFAKLDDEPFIVSVSRAVLEAVPLDPIQWQELAVYHFQPAEITALEITKGGQPPLSLELGKEKWSMAKGDGKVNQVNVQSLVNALARLRAVRWLGPALPEHRLTDPVLTLQFKTANGTTGKMVLGITTPEEMTLATVDSLSGAFLISRPDREALELPLLEKPAEPVPATP